MINPYDNIPLNLRALILLCSPRNSNSGGLAATYTAWSSGASGDLEICQTHAKISTPSNSNANLALNDSSASGADIFFNGSWTVYNDASPVGAINNNASGQIKLNLTYENDRNNVV